METIRVNARVNLPAALSARRKRTISKNCTVEAYAKRWTKRAAVYFAPLTLRGYEQRLRDYIIPELGKIQFTRLTRDKVAQFTTVLFARGLMRATVINIVAILRRMYYEAMEHGDVMYNPAASTLREIEKRKERPPYEPFSAQEARCFLMAAKSYEPHWYPLFLCALTTGMRRGELLAIRPRDIDFVTGFINVRSSLQGRVFRPPKSYKVRRVDMNERLAEVLSRVLDWKTALALEEERQKPRNERRAKENVVAEVMEKPLFTSLYGGRVKDYRMYKAFRRILKKAGLRHIRLHGLRHTYATLLLQQGESLLYIRDQLGHSFIQTTIDFYAHLIAGSNKAAVDRLVDAIDDASIRPAERLDRRTVPRMTRKSDFLRAWT